MMSTRSGLVTTPVNDRIYLSWTYFDTWGSSNPNDSSCIYLSWTEDAGATWVDPVRISDEKGNAQGGSYSMHGSYPTTGPSGEVYIAWWSPDGLMFDRSLDQGVTWLPVWMRMDDGFISLIGTIVNPQIIGYEEVQSSPLAILGNSPNPFDESTFISFKLREPTTVLLLLYDITGKRIATIIDNMEFSIEKHTEKIDANALGLQSGVYFAKLLTKSGTISKRLVFVD